MKIYNTLTAKLEDFQPISADKVRMYVCGVTPYNHCHIGHARCYTVFDTIRRYLTFLGYKVNYIQNFTDIDDKIINSANAENIEPLKLAERYIKSYFEDMDILNIQRADAYPRVSECIDDIILIIEKILANGYGYVIDGEVFFDVSKFDNYGKLSKRSLSEQKAGARVQTDTRKKNPLDFTLWKPAKPGEPKWRAPWSDGRPGWHIECSAMSIKYFQSTFDIHGGGSDLIFPHHENEIAQSEAALNQPFVKYWLHNGFVTIDKEKMSKSLNNFFLIKDVLKKFKPEVLRYFLISAHYRSPLDFSEKQLSAAAAAVEKLNNFLFELKIAKITSENNNAVLKCLDDFNADFKTAMDDDFNTAEALGHLHNFIHNIQKISLTTGLSTADKTAIISAFFEKLDIFGIKLTDNSNEKILTLENEKQNTDISKQLLDIILNIRTKAKQSKNYELADFIRNELAKLNFEIRDTKDGAVILKK